MRLAAAHPSLRLGDGGLGCRLLINARELIAARLSGNVLVQGGCRIQSVRAARGDLPWRGERERQPAARFFKPASSQGQGHPTSTHETSTCQTSTCQASAGQGSQGGYGFSAPAVAAWAHLGETETECTGMRGISPLDPGLAAMVPVACGPSDRCTDPQGTEDGQRYEQDQDSSRKSDEKIAVGVVHRVVAQYVPSQQGKDGNACGCKKGKKS
jgi:hypothetical protein